MHYLYIQRLRSQGNLEPFLKSTLYSLNLSL